jgi:two-component system sensor histidine kinase FlrB
MAARRTKARREPPELEHAMRAFSSISDGLLASYRELERRAQHVEGELCEKLAELDSVTRHLEAVLATLPTGVVVRDAQGRVVRANPAALAILGVDLERLRADPSVPGLAGASADGEPREVQCADGVRRVIASRHCPIASDDEHVPAGSVEILDDRTQITELTERLHGLDKLAALGNMAGGIAHEIRNPMNAVKGYAALLRKHAPPGSREARWSESICAGVDEADEILASMLTLAHPERLALETIDARTLVADAIAALGADDAEITTACPELGFAGDRVKLRQALRNLLVNALQAQANVQGVRPRVHVAATRAGDHVQLSVSDAGPGIPAELRKRVFDPFFTTRADGTGLGLALVSTIARLHGGRVEIPPGPASLGGAEVRLLIPFSPTTAAD